MKKLVLAGLALLAITSVAEAQYPYRGYYYGGIYPRPFGYWDGNNFQGPTGTSRYDGYPTSGSGYRFPNYGTREYNALYPDRLGDRRYSAGSRGNCRVVSVKRDGKTTIHCRWKR